MRPLLLPLGLSIVLLGSMVAAMAQVVTQDGEPVRLGTGEAQSTPVVEPAPAAAPAPRPQSEPVAPPVPAAQSAPAAQSTPAEQSAPQAATAEQSAPAEAPPPAAVAAEQTPVGLPAEAVPDLPREAPVAPAPRPAVAPPAVPRVPPVVAPAVLPASKSAAGEVRPIVPPPPPKPLPKAPASNLAHSAAPVVIPEGPAWTKGCKAIQMQGSALMCDADALLTGPSDKVQVYVRSANDVAREGRFIVRESLPMRYRFFLLQ
ncbi:hypothetical protein VVD49_03005 [Uliginosibacterium sp. H3]|uniref:Uncharacterized protein n=1 Tax=Uliginosibacterium silvisoli TaxID=3114758 RepID=A0ABU6K0R4_9RHOO|nr:hypothetical protein [Uliginosibacterium sp. H3]